MKPNNLKSYVTPLVMWSIHNHWIFLVTIIVFQYLLGETLAGEQRLPIPIEYIPTLHSLIGKVLLGFAILLTSEKLYLYLLRKGKI
jgi:hypothetical protein